MSERLMSDKPPRNLLVELFVEELPPKALKKLGDAFGAVLFERLSAQGLAATGAALSTFATPRRLAAHITNIREQAADEPTKTKLMPVSVAIKDGEPTQAWRKKLQALGLLELLDQPPGEHSGSSQLHIESDGKVPTYYLLSVARGVALPAGLQVALDDAIARLPIPKVMRYQLMGPECELPGWTSVSFVRPAHGLVALHGSEVVPLSALGLQSGRVTHGHRFEALVSPVVVNHADDYEATLLRDGCVIARFDDRRAEIVRQLQQACAGLGQGMRPIEDEALLDEVASLVERPKVLVCEFEPEFLAVPQECLILTMKANQKYFPLLDAQGRLTHRFLVVSNISPGDASAVVGGNERVVRPRLADAKFFFEQDRKKSLAQRVPLLAKVVYHNKLGTQGDRTQRVRDIARAIVLQLSDPSLQQAVDRAAELAKADLLTDMVGEFPELQGVMGGYYARHDGLGEEIALAIEDHYRPRFAGDTLPRNRVGLVVALADKLETLVGMFGIGNLPTGDRDPFALRRHALGVIRMLVEHDLPLPLRPLIEAALPAFGAALSDPTQALLDFIYDRLAGSLREQGYSAHEVDAVLALRPPRLGDITRRLQAVRLFAGLPEAAALAAANKRIGNILKKAPDTQGQPDAALMHEAAEKDLYAQMLVVVPGAQTSFEAGDYAASLQALAALRSPVDAFFEGVMVNAEQPDVRLNRLRLLATLHGAMNRVADLSRLSA